MGDIRIRFATPGDAGDLLAIYAPYVTNTAITFEYDVPAPAEFAARIAGLAGTYPYLVAETGGTPVGYAYASRHMERAAYAHDVQTSIYVAPRGQSRGLGKALYRCLLRLLAAQGYCVAYAAVAIPNPQSEGLHAALGFTPIGVFRKTGYKLGAWHDVLWLEKAIADRSDSPPEIRKPGELDPRFVRECLECESKAF